MLFYGELWFFKGFVSKFLRVFWFSRLFFWRFSRVFCCFSKVFYFFPYAFLGAFFSFLGALQQIQSGGNDKKVPLGGRLGETLFHAPAWAFL